MQRQCIFWRLPQSQLRVATTATLLLLQLQPTTRHHPPPHVTHHHQLQHPTPSSRTFRSSPRCTSRCQFAPPRGCLDYTFLQQAGGVPCGEVFDVSPGRNKGEEGECRSQRRGRHHQSESSWEAGAITSTTRKCKYAALRWNCINARASVGGSAIRVHACKREQRRHA